MTEKVKGKEDKGKEAWNVLQCMKKAKIISVLLCITMMTGIITACQSEEKKKEPEVKSTENESESTENEPEDPGTEAECVYQTQADLTHDGEDETLKVMVYPKSTQYPDGLYEINVYSAGEELLWSGQQENTSVETGAYYLVKQEGESYLLYYRADIVTSMGDYAYRLFYLKEDGSETESDADELSFTATNEDGVNISFSREELTAFAEKVNGYFADAYLLLDTAVFPVHYSTQEEPVIYEENYQLLMKSEGLSDTGDMEQNVEAFYEYLYSGADPAE